jgi:hypothetical protein
VFDIACDRLSTEGIAFSHAEVYSATIVCKAFCGRRSQTILILSIAEADRGGPEKLDMTNCRK